MVLIVTGAGVAAFAGHQRHRGRRRQRGVWTRGWPAPCRWVYQVLSGFVSTWGRGHKGGLKTQFKQFKYIFTSCLWVCIFLRGCFAVCVQEFL